MGCTSSTSTGVQDQRGNGQAPREQAGDNELVDVEVQDTGVYLTVGEAAQYVQARIPISDERAKNIVNNINKNSDNKISESELKDLWQKVDSEKKKLDDLFKKYDTDNSRHVTHAEAVEVLKNVIPGFPETNLYAMIKRFDHDNNEKLDYEEFSFFFASVKLKKDKIETSFEKLDTDDSGTISQDVLVSMLAEEFALDQFMAISLANDFDCNQDGQIDKKEFLKMWSNLFG